MMTTTTSDDHSDDIAIVYPSDWPVDDPEAHCTIMYLGAISEANYTKQDLEEAIRKSEIKAPGATPTIGLEMFGEDKDIPVIRLKSLLVSIQKKQLQIMLLSKGIEDASSFPDYKPHVTVSEPNVEIPTTVSLGAPAVWWGDER